METGTGSIVWLTPQYTIITQRLPISATRAMGKGGIGRAGTIQACLSEETALKCMESMVGRSVSLADGGGEAGCQQHEDREGCAVIHEISRHARSFPPAPRSARKI